MRRVIVIALSVVALAAGLFGIHDYRIGAKPPIGQLLWRNSEAFLFLGDATLGWRLTYGRAALARLFGALPSHSKATMTVIRVDRATSDRRSFENTTPPDLIAFGDAVHSRGARWTGDKFDVTSLDPVPQQLAGAPPQEFSNVEGWSKRSFILVPNGLRVIEFALEGKPMRLLLSVDAGVASIHLERQAGQQPERLWSAPQEPHGVSRAAYHATFP